MNVVENLRFFCKLNGSFQKIKEISIKILGFHEKLFILLCSIHGKIRVLINSEAHDLQPPFLQSACFPLEIYQEITIFGA